jgi:hypothetical protein
MPAVSLTRLREQLDWLKRHIHQPVEFHRLLSDLMSYYANRAYRPGMTVQSQPTLPTYRLPPLVNRHFEVMVTHLAREAPEQGLVLADELWQDAYLETRSLAAHLLGQLPPDAAVVERLNNWCRPGEDNFLLNEILNPGMENLRRSNASAWVELIQGWLKQGKTAAQSLGLHALIPAIRDEKFTNLPAVFNILEPFLKEPLAAVKNEILEVLEALAKRSPAETSFFVKKTILLHPHPLNLRITRQLIPCFSEETQLKLREALNEAQKS